jgi:hypothetical protein
VKLGLKPPTCAGSLKFDNPKVMEQIDAVFVTVEPKGGSDKSSGK